MPTQPYDPLADFNKRIGTSPFSPQQGSGLPIATQGGLPFGASSPTPPPVAPAPNFQAAPQQLLQPQQPQVRPSFQIGGPSPDVEAMIRQRLQLLQGPQDRSMSGLMAHDRALEELRGLSSLAGVRSQDRQLQQQYLKESAAQLEKFNALLPEQQATMRPFMSQYLKNTSKLAGMDVSDEDVAHALTSPNFAGTYASILNDPIVNQEQQQAYLSRIIGVPAGKPRDDVAVTVSKEIESNALSMIQTSLPQVVASMGRSAQKPVEMQELLTNHQVKEYLDKSPILKRTFNAYVSNKANEDFLASIGIKPGSVVTKQMEGPALSAGVKDMLATVKGPDGKPLVPGMATVTQIKDAQKAYADFEIKKAANQGLAVEEYKRTLPASGEELSKYLDVNTLVQTGEIKKPVQGTTLASLYQDTNLRFATPEQQERVSALKPTRAILDNMQVLGERLITADNAVEAAQQGIRLWVGAKTGANPEARAYMDTSFGFTSPLARAIGGEKGVLTDKDRTVVNVAVFASMFDTKSARLIKQEIVNDIYKASHRAVVGSIAGTGTLESERDNLKRLLQRLDNESAKSLKGAARADQYAIRNTETGEIGFVPKSGYKATKGWEIVK